MAIAIVRFHLPQRVKDFSTSPGLGRRPIKEISYEQGKDGRRFEKLTLGDYRWMSYKAVC